MQESYSQLIQQALDTHIISGKAFSELWTEELKNTLQEHVDVVGTRPQLYIIQVEGNPASNVYVRNKLKLARQIGIDAVHVLITPEQFNDYLHTELNIANPESQHSIDYLYFFIRNRLQEVINKNPTGIIVQLPINFEYFGFTKESLESSGWTHQSFERRIINKIPCHMDVDGLTDICQGQMATGDFYFHGDNFLPATPSGIIKLLTQNGDESFLNRLGIKNPNVCIIGRSNLLGKPLALMMMDKNGPISGATVTVCHSRTSQAVLDQHISNADIVVCCAGCPDHYIVHAGNVKPGAIVIDAAINVRMDEHGKRKLYGDADFENIMDKVSLITPVPGGVGPMTVFMLMENVVNRWIFDL